MTKKYPKTAPNFRPTMAWLIRRPVYWLGFGFGSGLSPVAPGTAGTLVALPLAYCLQVAHVSGWALAFLCLPLFWLGIGICRQTETGLGVHDYGGIVWDEIVAMLLVLAFVPMTWAWWLAAFAVFRFFDAVKPQPIAWFDRHVGGALGVMLDDIIAALMSILVLQATGYLLQ